MQFIIEHFQSASPVMKALYSTLFTWSATALGAAMVFFFKEIRRSILNVMLGFAAGVMIAASFWSLLQPAINLSNSLGQPGWLVASVGFLIGGAFLYAVDHLLPHLHLGNVESEGPKTSWHRSILLVMAITLHNIPEGLAVGVAFGAMASNLPMTTGAGAIVLAIGIALQNFPEGAAVSIPLRREGFSRLKSFMYGQASGLVEPFAGVFGALAVIWVQDLLPYALSFAAGAMIYVVVEELIPEAQQDEHTDGATIGAMLGFAIMMSLIVGLGA